MEFTNVYPKPQVNLRSSILVPCSHITALICKLMTATIMTLTWVIHLWTAGDNSAFLIAIYFFGQQDRGLLAIYIYFYGEDMFYQAGYGTVQVWN